LVIAILAVPVGRERYPPGYYGAITNGAAWERCTENTVNNSPVIPGYTRTGFGCEHLTFTFVTDGVESAVAQAKAAARDKAVQVVGGGSIAQELLDAGLGDEQPPP
jgi:hypothetical protein